MNSSQNFVYDVTDISETVFELQGIGTQEIILSCLIGYSLD
jgi:hypothetical protein